MAGPTVLGFFVILYLQRAIICLKIIIFAENIKL